MHPQSPKKETELQLYQQKSLKSVLITVGTGVQSTEQSTKIIISIRYCNCYYCAHSLALQVNPRLKKLMLYNQRQLIQKQLTLVHTIYVATKISAV